MLTNCAKAGEQQSSWDGGEGEKRKKFVEKFEMRLNGSYYWSWLIWIRMQRQSLLDLSQNEQISPLNNVVMWNLWSYVCVNAQFVIKLSYIVISACMLFMLILITDL